MTYKTKRLTGTSWELTRMNEVPRSRNVRVAVVVCCLVLLGAGVADRWLHAVKGSSTPAVLDQPLSALPLRIGSWEGIEVPLDQRILEVAGTDDYVNRHYVDQGSGQVVDLYLAYVSRPAKMLGHRPRVCYPAHGWTHIATKSDHVVLANGKELDCLIHHFTRGRLDTDNLVVLNYYVLQGRHTTEWTDFWGPQWRRPNLSRDASFYVAQAQFASEVTVPPLYKQAEEAVKRFAAEVIPHVNALLPLTDEPERYQGRSGGPSESGLP